MNIHPTEPHPKHQPRIEDHALVTGAGRFADDVAAPDFAYAHFVRAPHAFARIRATDVDEARRAPGVLAVLTGKEIAAAGVGAVSRHPPLPGRNGSQLVNPPRPVLASERVLHVGEAVALVVAETRLAAMDAAELVAVEYEPLAPVTDIRAAVEPGAPQLWPQAPGNVALEWANPADEAAVAEVAGIVAGAAHVARVTVVNQRLVVASMETRGATASYDAANDAYTLRACTQGANAVADQAVAIMGIKREQLRVYSEDVGGAFGMKTPAYPEYIALLVAARVTGRPVHWMSTRSESFLSDNQARDTVTEAELALDQKGKFQALRIKHLAGMGGYMSSHGGHIQTNNFARCFPTMYDIPKVAVEVRCAFTNTVPTGPYRGAGRPEANYVMERVVEEAARVTGIDRVALRRRNLIRRSAIPYKTPVGTTYDSGDFAPILKQALQLADAAGFPRRRREAMRRGKRRGLGISCFLEHSGGVPTEGASITFTGKDSLQLGLGLHSTGQGHASVFSRLAAERLQIGASQVRVRQGDTALGVAGYASVASRGAMTVSHAVIKVVEAVLEKGRKAASVLLEAAEADIAYRDGHFEVVGTDRRLSLFEVAARAKALTQQGAESLDSNVKADTPQAFPNGVHIAEVEIDPDTGETAIVSFTAVDDCGHVLDHMIVEGQVHGAVAQGLGQVLFENAVYDAGGQLVAGSFMDYAMPRAHHMPPIRDALHNVPATTNPLGVKGAGEGGTIGSLAALVNAIIDAIPDDRGRALDMPLTTEKIWRAYRGDA
jgi:aerobic carbon-monoxide dehydrogenase large subunit